VISIIRHNRLWEKQRWVEQSNRRNPRHKDFEAPVNLDQIVVSSDSTVAHNDNSAFGWVPYKLRYGVAAAGAAFVLLLNACSGGGSPTITENPTPRPPRSEQTLEATQQPPQITIEDLTIEMRHPYQPPSNPGELFLYNKFVEENKDFVGYGKAVRFLNDTLWVKSAIGVAAHP